MFAAAYELLDQEQRKKLAERLLGSATAEEQNALMERLESYNFVQPPTIIAPRQLLPVEQIVTYDPIVHRQLFRQGFADAVRDMRHMVSG